MRRAIDWIVVGLLVSLLGCGGGEEKPDASVADATPPTPVAPERPVERTPPANDPPPGAPQIPVPSEPAVPVNAANPPAGTVDPTVDPTADPAASPADGPVDPAPATEPAEPTPTTPVELTAEEIRTKTLRQMAAIGKALEAYAAEHGRYPPPAIYDADGKPLLSWRVLLLPLLGEQALFDKFKLDQAWDGPENMLLLNEIPAVYNAHNSMLGKTNFLAPSGSGTVFDDPKGTPLESITDGVLNTALLLEVDDARAAPWSSPQDHRPSFANARAGMGRRQQDGILALFGGLNVVVLKPETPEFQIRAIYTIAKGEPVKRTAVGRDLNKLIGLPLAADAVPEEPGAGEEGDPSNPGSAGEAVDGKRRAPIPSQEDQNTALALLRETYKNEYDSAKSREEKQELGTKLVDQGLKIRAPTAERFILLKVGMDVAAKNGESGSAIAAVSGMADSFEIDRMAISVATITKLDTSVRNQSENTRLFKEAAELIEQVMQEDRFEQAGEIFNVAISSARRSGNRVAVGQIEDLRKMAFDRKSLYADLEQDFATLQTMPMDPMASLNVGRYYILLKGDWLHGLPLLAQSSDETLRQLAADDIAGPATPEDQIKLADRWWEQSVKPRGAQFNWPKLRAAQWYRLAVGSIGEGLLKVQADRRIKEVTEEIKPAMIPELIRVPKEEKAG